jgi:8-oxo-dGTP pyrophosphatase MutT (NUDIX family)
MQTRQTSTSEDVEAPVRTFKAAGIVPYFVENDELKFLLIKGSFGWEFPKGHIEEGESTRQTAKRETEEETGLIIKHLRRFIYLSKYMVRIDFGTRKKLKHPIPKVVTYFLGEADTKNVKLSFEHSEYGWFAQSEAMEKLSRNKRKVLEAALCELN